MEKIVEKTLLFDFYGELLTGRQREIYSEVVFNDMSLAEAAQEYGVSRQGVHDTIRRCDQLLREYEDRLHLMEQFDRLRKISDQMKELLSGTSFDENMKNELLKKLNELQAEIG